MRKIKNKWIHTKIEKKKMSKAMKGSKIDIKKGKTYEEYFGINKAKEIKLKLSKQTSSRSQKVYDKISKALKGRKLSNEWRNKLRLARLSYISKNCKNIKPYIGHNEKQILDKLELELGYKIIRQYPICGYFIDGYIPELNLAIEIDESYHLRRKQKDKQRQKEIEKELNCKFIRFEDKN